MLDIAHPAGSEHFLENSKVLDAGCGCGIIYITLLKKMTSWTAVGFEILEEAVKLSEENAGAHGVADRSVANACDVYGLNEGRVFDFFVSSTPSMPEDKLDVVIPEV